MPTILEKLKAAGIKSVAYSEVEEPIKIGKAPRDKLASHIQDSMNLLEDPSYTVKGLKGKMKTPVPCYIVKDGTATIRLKYFRKPLDFAGKPALTVQKSELLETLKALKDVALSGDFDSQLESIRADRSKAMKKKK